MKTYSTAIRLLLLMTLLTGLAYPLFINGIAQIFFPSKANGSMIERNGKMVGSEWIGQTFNDNKYFSSRPSAIKYNPLPSGASNLGLTNVKLKTQFDARINTFLEYNKPGKNINFPSEMAFASASGLDPHISLNAALLQVPRISSSRSLNIQDCKLLYQLVYRMEEPRQFGFLGEPRINVLLLNLETDKMFK